MKGCYGIKDTSEEVAVGSANGAERFFSDEIIFDQDEEIPVGAGLEDDVSEIMEMLDHFDKNSNYSYFTDNKKKTCRFFFYSKKIAPKSIFSNFLKLSGNDY